MGKITLEGMSFYAHHGYYTDERKRGNNYTVDVTVSYDLEEAAKTDDLHAAVNYEKIYAICKKEMNNPQHLIETVARNIAKGIQRTFPKAMEITIEIKKHAPELGGPVQSANVTYVIGP